MLQLIDVRKTYKTADFTQVALNDISVSFRDNEFVAILGSSGSGKTTLLNIIGGLDHYDSGNLFIDGISTERYKDRDWDAYRNNRIGFVFQSYNLITHQTLLSNVELALTLSGVSKKERRQRAKEALETVGLGEHSNKKPSQLSGGQMQRVAIARALINDPEILLADEPTGALDSKTSLQIMALLTEIAKDRLVIMVTHNPELAEEYATRTIHLKDGSVEADSEPFLPSTTDERISQKPSKKTVMSFFTALALSFNNLLTKKGRTLLTSFAGSIGIIGIAAILALANGVNAYIKSVEEDTLSLYPLTISSTGIDLTAMMTTGSAGASDDTEKEEWKDAVHERKTLTHMFSGVGSNDLAALKTYFDSGTSGISPYVNSIQYSYNVTPRIYSPDTTEGVRQVNPDNTFSAMGFGGGSGGMNSFMSMGLFNTDVFAQLIDDPKMLDAQYNVVAGRWPTAYNECVLVLSDTGGVSDLLLYAMGKRDPLELKEMVRAFANGENVTTPEDSVVVPYDEMMKVNFKLVNPADFYQFDAAYNVWTDKSSDPDFMKALVNGGTDISISGIVMPNPDASATTLGPGLYYPASLTKYLMATAAESPIVKSQLENTAVDVFTGKTFEEEASERGASGLDLGSLITIDKDAISNGMKIDMPKLDMDLAGLIDPASLTKGLPAPAIPDLAGIASSLNVRISGEQAADLVQNIVSGYIANNLSAQTLNPDLIQAGFTTYLNNPDIQAKIMGATAENISTVMSEILTEYLTTVLSQQVDVTGMTGNFVNYFNSPEVQQTIAQTLPTLVNTEEIQTQLMNAMQGYIQSTMETYMAAIMTNVQKQIGTGMQAGMSQMTESMMGMMNFDPEVMSKAFQFNMAEKELTQLLSSFMTTEEKSSDNNLLKLGYANAAKPSSIDIYPIDFAGKEKVLAILDGYNERMKNEQKDDQVITYTDIVGTLMTSVTDIINKITAILVAFVAISLVVSSIMIGVITYISVLERKKEIGILRSIGASKRDIGNVFNAETLIVGFIAGMLGVGITLIASVFVNAIVYAHFDVPNIARLPLSVAAILVAVSMVLTFLAGLIPASAASRKDPVEALRSE
ncbi:hypothetical protein FACS1894111_06960 [Clostridia bacterium]|nr:hypothetical protein FACS1894111_06960 [Clostridia bacterium]